ncbi:sensor histidine kinase [Neolewinella agarilytica]|uniref:Y_Y_Y domain-containing protein n=1 Tax=Neolewinella agarilytica TaxID=478744 RepID=A0A1H9HFN4_9BACT|nr:histidine kinase [Neolewinella agarilytica]SEQ61104.1 Y_Y_Y domain-containing protein [Neolewinella agarilytica]
MYSVTGTGIKGELWGLLTLLFATFLCTCVSAQNRPLDTVIYEIPYRKLTVREGLTRNQIMEVWQDRDGFVWLAGKLGVDRFDGLEVLSYQNDTNAIREYILDIDEDADGTLWFFGQDVDYSYDGGTFERKKRDAGPDHLVIARINSETYRFSTSQAGEWNLTRDSVVIGGFPAATRYPFAVTDDTTGAALWPTFYPAERDTLFYQKDFPNGPIRPLASGEHMTHVHEADARSVGTYWIDDSLYQIKDGHLVFEQAFPLPGFIGELTRHEGKVFARYLHSVVDPQGERPVLYAGKDQLVRIFQRGKRLLIPGEQGLVTLRPDDALTIFPTELGMLQNVWSMMGAGAGAGGGTKGAMFFFPYSERSILKLENGCYTRITGLTETNDRHFYPGIFRRSNGHLLVPTNKRVYDFDPVTEQLRPLDGPERRATNDLLETGNTIYAATRGLAVYEDEQLRKVYGQADGLDVAKFGYFETLGLGRDGRLWLGSHRGLAVREPDGSFHNYPNGAGVPAGVVDIKTDYRGNLWFATHRGVAFYDYTDSLPRWVTPGFTEDVKFVQPIGEEYLLLGGTNKLYFLDLPAFYRDEISIYPYDEDDGFPFAECLQAAVHLDEAGHVWVGTTESVVKIEPNRLVFHFEPTLPEFLSFSYLDPLTDKEIEYRIPYNVNGEQHFSISSTDQRIKVRFFTINHEKPRSIRYQYRLRGYRNGWSRPEPTRYAEFGELPPGEYTFELRTCLLGKCTPAKSMKITVYPGRWYEYWFIPWLAGFLGLLPFALIAYQWWQRRRAELLTQRLEVDRLQLYRRLTQHKIGPHFANNALTAISNLIVRNENERALRYTGRFARLFRPVLEDGLPLLRPLREELDFIEDYLKLEKLRFPQKLRYDTQIDERVRERAENILVPSLLIQSFVNNAVKHGIEPLESGGELALTLRLTDDDYLLVEITDNGPGYFVDGEPTGTGIRAASEILSYLDEHHGSNSRIEILLRDPLLVNSGTIVRLHLYLNYETLD